VEAIAFFTGLILSSIYFYEKRHVRCENDGNIMVEGTLNHLICPKCRSVKHLGD
jgi:hypothetical protein